MKFVGSVSYQDSLLRFQEKYARREDEGGNFRRDETNNNNSNNVNNVNNFNIMSSLNLSTSVIKFKGMEGGREEEKKEVRWWMKRRKKEKRRKRRSEEFF